MEHHDPWRHSILSLSADLLLASVLLWLIGIGRDVELQPSTHWFFYDRYHQLAAHHRRKGRSRRAARLERVADTHLREIGGHPPHDDPPAAAMAMPRRRRTIRVTAAGPAARGRSASDARGSERHRLGPNGYGETETRTRIKPG
jgi:YD repeat-containing protein